MGIDRREVDEPTEAQDELAPTTGEPQTMAELLAESEREAALRSRRASEIGERRWLDFRELERSGEVIEAPVTEANRGGVVVDVGLRGFVPLSQLSSIGAIDRSDEARVPGAIRELVGRKLPLKVIEVDQKRNRLILSEKAAAQAIRRKRKAQAAAELNEGDVLEGTVTQITGFGLFVDVGVAEGLVHRSEVTWDKAVDPLGIYEPGDAVRVQVTGIDRERERISLSIRRLVDDPWRPVGTEFTQGADVDATVTRLMPFGAFARIAEGLEGLIHISEMADGHVDQPSDAVQVGQQVRVRIVGIDPERRRLSLSIRQAGS
jgi:small subunit ribosomal protein S1